MIPSQHHTLRCDDEIRPWGDALLGDNGRCRPNLLPVQLGLHPLVGVEEGAWFHGGHCRRMRVWPSEKRPCYKCEICLSRKVLKLSPRELRDFARFGISDEVVSDKGSLQFLNKLSTGHFQET